MDVETILVAAGCIFISLIGVLMFLLTIAGMMT